MLDRIVAIDVETTGVSPEGGDKIIEIAAIEMIDLQITSNVFHQYIHDSAFAYFREVLKGIQSAYVLNFYHGVLQS